LKSLVGEPVLVAALFHANTPAPLICPAKRRPDVGSKTHVGTCWKEWVKSAAGVDALVSVLAPRNMEMPLKSPTHRWLAPSARMKLSASPPRLTTAAGVAVESMTSALSKMAMAAAPPVGLRPTKTRCAAAAIELMPAPRPPPLMETSWRRSAEMPLALFHTDK
jgi:hypothetical protein